MMASQAAYMECVKLLLDKRAKVNMQNNVSDVIIHCVLAMHHVPRVPSSGNSTLVCWSGYRVKELVWRPRPKTVVF